MTLQELVDETLMQKHTRLRQEKCKHEDTYASGVRGPNGDFWNKFCWDCGKTWRYEKLRTQTVGGHGSDVQTTSGPALSADEAKAETASKPVPRSGPSRGITDHQSEPPTLCVLNR